MATTFQRHSRMGYCLTSTLISLEVVELSSSLRSLSTFCPPSLTIVKSYLGLPQFCFCQPGGTPRPSTSASDQFSTTTGFARAVAKEASARVPRSPMRNTRIVASSIFVIAVRHNLLLSSLPSRERPPHPRSSRVLPPIIGRREARPHWTLV